MTLPLTFEQATHLAQDWVARYSSPDNELVLVLEETLERPYGWFFSYDSKQFLATQDFAYAIAGNAPLLVDKRGQVQETGTAHSLEHYVAEFDAKYQGSGFLS